MLRPDVTVLVVTWRARELLRKCLAALAAQTVAHRLLVVDNASDDGTAALLAARFRTSGCCGCRATWASPAASRPAWPRSTPWVALLNDDAEPAPGWLAALLAAVEPGVVAVTSRLLLPSGAVNNTGVVLRPDGYGADRGLGAPDGPPYTSRRGLRLLAAERPCCEWRRCGPPVAFPRRTSSTTRTPTPPGGSGWPAAGSGTRRAPWSGTRTRPARTRRPRSSPSTTSATGCSR